MVYCIKCLLPVRNHFSGELSLHLSIAFLKMLYNNHCTRYQVQSCITLWHTSYFLKKFYLGNLAQQSFNLRILPSTLLLVSMKSEKTDIVLIDSQIKKRHLPTLGVGKLFSLRAASTIFSGGRGPGLVVSDSCLL